MTPSPENVTQLLVRWGNGDQTAFDQLMPIVYAELRRMARGYMTRQDGRHTLQTTALVHEAYFKLVGEKDKRWQNKTHFFAVAAKAMRHVLVDYARSRQTAKRGGGQALIPLDDAQIPPPSRMGELVELDDALTELSTLNPRQAEVVEMRFFGGLAVEEVAQSLNVSPETVMRDWRAAKAWLYQQLSGQSGA
jgi:RNA polymerase sigma-70 factor (ECF subfamily)